MAETITTTTDFITETTAPGLSGHPQEDLEIEEPTPAPQEDDAQYPSGTKLWMSVASLSVVSVLHGLDLTIVAATIPSLTNHFKTIDDIGWYSSAYSVMAASFGLVFGKLYSIVSPKKIFISSLAIFELGSLICTVAPTSWSFILGRAVAGIGISGIMSGSVTILAQCFPRHKRAIWTTLVGSAQMIGIVSAPMVGGGLIDWVGWRACFGINLPLGVVTFVGLFYGLQDSPREVVWKNVIKDFDILGTFFMVPSITCLILALQWGGIRFGWNNVRIVILFILFGILSIAFGWRQHRLQEKGTLPPRIIKMRTVLAGMWFCACSNGTLAVTEYFITIYFQGVKGYTATHSGTLLLPMLIGILVGSLGGGIGTNHFGYYNPFMIATSVLAPIASGLLTTIRLDDTPTKALCLLGFLGMAVGLGIQSPIIALQATMDISDLPIGIAIVGFGSTMGNAIWIVVSTALFQNRLVAEVTGHSPGVNATSLVNAGLSEIRNIVGDERLRDVLLGYDEAVTQTLYVPVALTVATFVSSVFADWHSVKKKRD